ncbi:hypothetical protein BU16DRAFT_535405 [Lophium mytilinum]|uniref:Uncharacterized protein n=1 Tax=Lophium mytilinum TaxID=390894 RepID=A0A6A6RAX4_9PEZI|nr:hypothetical protein BU16DRAFT_535405 [Lophium mytilinum]
MPIPIYSPNGQPGFSPQIAPPPGRAPNTLNPHLHPAPHGFPPAMGPPTQTLTYRVPSHSSQPPNLYRHPDPINPTLGSSMMRRRPQWNQTHMHHHQTQWDLSHRRFQPSTTPFNSPGNYMRMKQQFHPVPGHQQPQAQARPQPLQGYGPPASGAGPGSARSQEINRNLGWPIQGSPGGVWGFR